MCATFKEVRGAAQYLVFSGGFGADVDHQLFRVTLLAVSLPLLVS
jgi:hypothetical protein